MSQYEEAAFKALMKDNEWLKAALIACNKNLDTAIECNDRQKAVIDKLRAQEPHSVNDLQVIIANLFLEVAINNKEEGWGLFVRPLAEAIHQLYTQPQPASISEGYQLVPKEPTREMNFAADTYATETKDNVKGFWWWGRVYKAMLAAAPQAPSEVKDAIMQKESPDEGL